MIEVSAHARERARQRAISDDALDAAIAYGTRWPRRGGRERRTIDLDAVRRARANGRDLSGWLWVEVVIGGGMVATTYRLTLDQRRARRRREERSAVAEEA